MTKKQFKAAIIFKLHQNNADAIVINHFRKWLDDNTPDTFDKDND